MTSRPMCDRFEELSGALRERELTDPEIDEYVAHVAQCRRHVGVGDKRRAAELRKRLVVEARSRDKSRLSLRFSAPWPPTRVGWIVLIVALGALVYLIWRGVAENRVDHVPEDRLDLQPARDSIGIVISTAHALNWGGPEDVGALVRRLYDSGLLLFKQHETQAKPDREDRITTELQEDARLLTVRGYRHYPDVSQGAAMSADERPGLVEVAGDRFEAPLRRLLALSALTGAGTPDLLASLREWCQQQKRSGEERRLCVRAAGEIIRRAHACRLTAGVDLAVVQEFIDDLFRVPGWPGIPDDVRDLVRAAVLAQPEVGRSQRFREYVEALQQREFQVGPVKEYFSSMAKAFMLSAVGSSEARQWMLLTLRENEGLLENESQAARFGHVCGLLGSGEVTEEMRERCRGTGRPSALAAFQRGTKEAELEKVGVRKDLLSPLTKGADNTLSVARLRESTASRAADLTDPRVPIDLAAIVAEWGFFGNGEHDVVASGPGVPGESKAGLDAKHVTRVVSEARDKSRVMMARPGRSALSLTFDLESHLAIELQISVIKEGDHACMFDGEPRLSVVLDGHRVAREIPVVSESWYRITLRLDVQQTYPGQHTLDIHLSDLSTTACNIAHVAIVKVPEKK